MATRISRRALLGALGTGTALGALSRPHVACAQAATLKITTWGGKWGEVMKGEVIPAFER